MGEIGTPERITVLKRRRGRLASEYSGTRTEKEKDGVIDSWKKKGFAEVPIGLTSETIVRAMDAFMNFIQLPEDQLQAIQLTHPGTDRVIIGTGIREAKKDSDAEDKIYFHYHPDVLEQFEKEIIAAGPEAEAFLKEAHHIWEAVTAYVHDFIENTLSKAYPDKKFIQEGATHPQVTLRFLAYRDTGEGEYLAKAHVDRGGMTLAVAESAPGLWLQQPDGNEYHAEHKEGVALLFPGFGFNEQIDPDIPPTRHGVRQASNERYSETCARWALVVFIDFPGASLPSKKITVGS